MKIFDCKSNGSTSDLSFISDKNNCDKLSDLSFNDEPLTNTVCHNVDYINDDEPQSQILEDPIKLESNFTNNNKIKLKNKRKNPFIIDEAQVDKDDENDDEYDENNSKLNNTINDFIVDHTLSDIDIEDDQHRQNDDSIYLKSTKDIIGVPQNTKYKLKFDYNINQNVYSQPVVEIDEEDEYEMDSFCNDEIVYASDKDEDKDEISFDNKFANRKKRSPITKTTSTPINPKKKRRRIIIKSPEI